MKTMHKLSAAALAVTSVLALPTSADQTSRTNGMRDNTPSLTAIQNATVVTEPGEVVTNATLIIENGKVKSVESGNRAPAGARVIDGTGYTIYPGFIDPYASYGIDVTYEKADTDKPIITMNVKVETRQMTPFTLKKTGTVSLKPTLTMPKSGFLKVLPAFRRLSWTVFFRGRQRQFRWPIKLPTMLFIAASPNTLALLTKEPRSSSTRRP